MLSRVKWFTWLMPVVVSLAPVQAEDPPAAPVWSVSGGVVGSVADPEFGTQIEGSGIFLAAQLMLRSGVLFQFSSSASSDEESGPVEFRLLRAGFTAGYMFRRHAIVRPFVHGGLSSVAVEEEVAGLEILDDSSQAMTIGVGLLAGKNHHNFYLDLTTDVGHEIANSQEFDLTEAHVGYAYRF